MLRIALAVLVALFVGFLGGWAAHDRIPDPFEAIEHGVERIQQTANSGVANIKEAADDSILGDIAFQVREDFGSGSTFEGYAEGGVSQSPPLWPEKPWPTCSDSLSSASYAAVSFMTSLTCIAIVTVLLLAICICVANGLARRLIPASATLIFAVLLLIASDLALTVVLGVEPCAAQKYGLLATALLSPLTFYALRPWLRTLGYLCLGFGTGLFTAATCLNLMSIITSIAPNIPQMLSAAGLAVLGVSGVGGAVLLWYTMPLTVKYRAIHNEPNDTFDIKLPYNQADVYVELLSAMHPLGTSGYYSTEGTTVTTNSKGESKTIVAEMGTRRTHDGSLVSQLLTGRKDVIKWKQLETRLPGANMIGSGPGDEPGMIIRLRTEADESANPVTTLTLDYFYAEITEDVGLTNPIGLFKAPTLPLTQEFAKQLELKMIDDMAARGYTRTASDATAAPPAATASPAASPAAASPAVTSKFKEKSKKQAESVAQHAEGAKSMV